jgi:gliding motility-associated-like protein
LLQPTCAVTTGTINITSPTGNNIQYNINGTAFQSGTSFPGLIPSSYSLTTKIPRHNVSSTAKIVVINPIPFPPAAPTIGNIIQPSCTIQKGTVIISAPAGTNFEYSINNSGFQAGNSFANLASGNYTLVVRDIATSCISTSTATTINPPPALPPTPVARVKEQPTCIISAGTIVVAAPSGTNYQYSVDGLQYQSSATFANLAPGPYQITVKDQSIDCISLPATVVVNANINSPGMYLIPTAFSPNHDGINECFGIKYWGVISEFQLIIYNRWGQTVFSTSNPNDCWDGVSKGVTASEGNYVYYIKAKTLCGPVEKRGNVLLIR